MSPEIDRIPPEMNPFDAALKPTVPRDLGAVLRSAAPDPPIVGVLPSPNAAQEFAERAARAEHEVSPETGVDVAELAQRLDQALVSQGISEQRISELESQLSAAAEKANPVDQFPGGQECQSLDKQFWLLTGELLHIYETRRNRTPDHRRTILRYAIGRLQAEFDVVPAG